MRITAAAGAERADPTPTAPAAGDSTYFLELAESYRSSGQLHKAVRLLEGILEGEPGCVPGYALLAHVLTDEGRHRDALAWWERLLELEPQDDRARRAIGELRSRIAEATPLPDGSDTSEYGVRPPRLSLLPASPAAAAEEPLDLVVGLGPHDVHGAGVSNSADERGINVDALAPMEGSAPAAAQVTDLTLGLADLLMGLLEFRDPYFRGSSSQTRLLAGAMARRLGLPEAAVRDIELAAVLRDLGQLPIRALVSQVGSGLSDEVKRHVEGHVDTALDLVRGLDLPQTVRDAIRLHHERWDGSGYPDALRREQIPMAARIVAAADTFAAMIAARPHRLPQRTGSALDDMKAWAGTLYDPAVVDALVNVVEGPGWQGPGFGLRQHLVVVDAHETRAMIAAVRLCSHGYLAEAAFSSESALKRLRRSRISQPAGFIISAGLPHGEAIGLLCQLRDSGRTAAVPVVITHADAAARPVFLRAGADACLAPDGSFEELNATVEALLRRFTPHDAASASPGSGENAWAGLQGDLEEFPLSWLLQVLNYDARTAGVFVVGKEDEGAIYLDRGVPRFAQTRNLTGEEAYRAMRQWPAGSFTVDPDAKIDQPIVSTPLVNLLLEQAVVDDHSAFFDAPLGQPR
jgi:HD-GYP domain-containing protein (c-di-GMP phosphodiesterase class II)/DNA-binding response OmpR family regulator